MTLDLTTLDAHEAPPDALRATWKAYSRAEKAQILESGVLDEVTSDGRNASSFRVAGIIDSTQQEIAFQSLSPSAAAAASEDVKVYHHPLLPGLLIAPNLLPETVQRTLLDTLIHRDLSNPLHQTNLHLHYKLPYPPPSESFFSHSPSGAEPSFVPKDSTVHRSLSTKQVLERRLHWVTLGGQYDWSNRVYPELEASLPGKMQDGEVSSARRLPQQSPDFPRDIAEFLETLFPDTQAQAAIVNFYTPGDTMMMHRDVSERTDKGLVSLSLGCDAVFMIAPNETHSEAEGTDRVRDPGGIPSTGEVSDERQYLLLRLRSGDAMYMTKESRYAWHGVPKVLKDTCPEHLRDWPASEEDGKYDAWRGWMQNKRINLNVRQMVD